MGLSWGILVPKMKIIVCMLETSIWEKTVHDKSEQGYTDGTSCWTGLLYEKLLQVRPQGHRDLFREKLTVHNFG